MNSGTVVAGTDGCTTITYDTRMTPLTGAMSRIKLKPRFGVNRIRGANLQKRVAIGGCLHNRFGGDIAGSTRPVLDYELLAKSLRQPLTHEACDDVGSRASRKADDDAHRPRRIDLRRRDARHRRKRGSASGQMQKSAAGKFHFEPPSQKKRPGFPGLSTPVRHFRPRG